MFNCYGVGRDGDENKEATIKKPRLIEATIRKPHLIEATIRKARLVSAAGASSNTSVGAA